MAEPTRPSPASSSDKRLIPAEWSVTAADTVVETIAKVRDKTTRPALVAARFLVYGIVVAVLAVTILVLLIVVGLRMFNNWVPGQLWIAYAGLAVIFIAAGLICLRRANRPVAIR